MGKYDKYVHEIKAAECLTFKSHEGCRVHPFEFHKWYFDEAPNFISIYYSYAPGGYIGTLEEEETVNHAGEKRSFKKGGIHKHPAKESFVFLGTDPHNPDDLGGEHEFWIGEGDEAEKILVTKTTIIIVPENVAHNPNFCRRCYRPYFMFVVLDAPEMKAEPVDVFPPGFVMDIPAQPKGYGFNV